MMLPLVAAESRYSSASKGSGNMSFAYTYELPPCRMLIVGNGCAGKERLASDLSRLLHQPQIDLSAICPEETPRGQYAEETALQVQLILDAHDDGWITHGNFYAWRPLLWTRADTLIWLDYSLWHVVCRTAWRGLRSLFTFNRRKWCKRAPRMRPSTPFKPFSGLAAIKHAIRLHCQLRNEYPMIIGSYPRLCVYRFRSPRETAQWFEQLELAYDLRGIVDL
ncbi:hypothetical protein SYNPS1DRAFT_26609 [Syncephalis pseudoplumigaleata]|uniref:P-loop containing nucleoside triphosphate hydrolase protein n=1 Tax=Syncephalis pseudoplumigaleata TaxID=1712513 RepID=A0A4P9Z7Q1_9FUNG|nr:hypothetical protein SYNPS1DRAFT_26609 [Syncephalis pseudoplumigaleata]|eukprot:RKP27750.1 hypothetical protein SYNPS1DRAFT_26609 [Syncephalis pseudoplumigaleata]